jgi:putative copper resistance protein D
MGIYQLQTALTALDFWALFSCIGLLVARVALLPPTAFGLAAIAKRWQGLLDSTLAMLVVTGLALPLVRVMEMGGNTLMASVSMLPGVLQQTHFGHVWIMHLAGLLLLWTIRFGAQGNASRRPAIAMLATAVLLTLSYSATTHAADRGDFSLVEIGDWLHVLAASLWGGGILATGMLLPTLWGQFFRQRQLIGHLASWLSTLSAIALMLVLVTGIYNATTRISSADDLLYTSYGHVLIAKLLLVAAMIMVGAVNRMVLVPAVTRWAASENALDKRPVLRFCAAIGADVILVLAVLCLAALLIQSMPPSTMAEVVMRHVRL